MDFSGDDAEIDNHSMRSEEAGESVLSLGLLKNTSWESIDPHKHLYIDGELNVYYCRELGSIWCVRRDCWGNGRTKIEFDDSGEPCINIVDNGRIPKIEFDDSGEPCKFTIRHFSRSSERYLRCDEMKVHNAINEKTDILESLRHEVRSKINCIAPENLQRICTTKHNCRERGCYNFLFNIHRTVCPMLDAMRPILTSIEKECDGLAAEEESKDSLRTRLGMFSRSMHRSQRLSSRAHVPSKR